MITQKRLKELLSYDPLTGKFTRLKTFANALKGSVCDTRHARGYIVIRIDTKLYLAHRLAWLYINGKFPNLDIDHINQNPSDNRIKNLRSVSKAQNMRNQRKKKNNKSGVTGVYRDKRNGHWIAYIRESKKRRHLGSFEEKKDAIAARKEADIKYDYHKNHGS